MTALDHKFSFLLHAMSYIDSDEDEVKHRPMSDYSASLTPHNSQQQQRIHHPNLRPLQLHSPPPSNEDDGCSTCPRCCAYACRICPCAHIQYQLGLRATSTHDSLRVYARFASLLMMSCSFLYFLLLLSFTRWFDYQGSIAFISLTFCILLMHGVIGWYASKGKSGGSGVGGGSGIDASMINSGDSSSLAIHYLPPHPYALVLWKWLSLHPLSLLGFFLAVFLGCAMMGIMDFDSRLTLASRQQTFTVLLLGATSIFALLLQFASFMLASAWQQIGESSDEEEEAMEWQRQRFEVEQEQRGARLDAEE